MKAHEVDEWCREMLAAAERNFNRDGALDPVGIFLATRKPIGGAPFEAPTTVPFPMADLGPELRDNRDAWADFMTWMAKETKAIALLFISEAWLVQEVTGTEATARDVYERAYRFGSLKHHPERVEVLIASFQRLCMGATTVYRAEIIRAQGRPARVGRFVEVPGGGEAEGRFVNMMEPGN